MTLTFYILMKQDVNNIAGEMYQASVLAEEKGFKLAAGACKKSRKQRDDRNGSCVFQVAGEVPGEQVYESAFFLNAAMTSLQSVCTWHVSTR